MRNLELEGMLRRDAVMSREGFLTRDAKMTREGFLTRDVGMESEGVLQRDADLAREVMMLRRDADMKRESVLQSESIVSRDANKEREVVFSRDASLPRDGNQARDVILSSDANMRRGPFDGGRLDSVSDRDRFMASVVSQQPRDVFDKDQRFNRDLISLLESRKDQPEIDPFKRFEQPIPRANVDPFEASKSAFGSRSQEFSGKAQGDARRDIEIIGEFKSGNGYRQQNIAPSGSGIRDLQPIDISRERKFEDPFAQSKFSRPPPVRQTAKTDFFEGKGETTMSTNMSMSNFERRNEAETRSDVMQQLKRPFDEGKSWNQGFEAPPPKLDSGSLMYRATEKPAPQPVPFPLPVPRSSNQDKSKFYLHRLSNSRVTFASISVSN